MFGGVKPFDAIAAAVGTENRVRCIFQIIFRLVGSIFYDLCGIVTGLIAAKDGGDGSVTLGKAEEFLWIFHCLRYRDGAC